MKLKKVQSLKHIHTFHTLGVVKYANDSDVCNLTKNRLRIEKTCLKTADLNIATCPQQRNYLRELVSDKGYVEIIPCGTDPNLFGSISHYEARRKLEIESDLFNILYVGRTLSRLDPYEIECLTPVEADCIPYRDWHLVAKEVRNCYQDAQQLLYILKQACLEDKLIELLVYLGSKFGCAEGKSKAISLPLTHRELAEFFGVTRANIVAVINKLQCRKIIDNPRQGVIILHPSEIVRLEYKI